MKDIRDRRDDEDRENGTNGDDRKGSLIPDGEGKPVAEFDKVPLDSPIPAHDELDTAE